MDDVDDANDSILKHKPLCATYNSRRGKKKRTIVKKEGDVYRTYGTKVILV